MAVMKRMNIRNNLKTNYGDFDDFLEYRFKINNHLLEKDK